MGADAISWALHELSWSAIAMDFRGTDCLS